MTLPMKPELPLEIPEQYIMMFYGGPGVGKTTFVNSFGDVFFISTDRGTRHLSAMRKEVSSWRDVTKVVKELTALHKEGRLPYRYICIDHIDDIATLAEQEVQRVLDITHLGQRIDGAWGAGWSTYKQLLFRFMGAIMALDVGVILIAHETIKTINSGAIEVDRTQPNMTKTVWDAFVPKTDIVGYLGTQRRKKGGRRETVRVLITKPEAGLYAKDRTRRRKSADGVEIVPETPDDSASEFLARFNAAPRKVRKRLGNEKENQAKRKTKRKTKRRGRQVRAE